MHYLSLFTLLSSLLLFSCAPAPQPQSHPPLPGANTQSVHDGIVRLVPIGTPIAEAQAKMQAQGFSCTPADHALICEHLETLQPGINRDWTVVLSHDNQKITAHTVSASIVAQRPANQIAPPPPV